MSTDSMSTALRFAVLISARVSADSGVAMQLQQRQTFFFVAELELERQQKRESYFWVFKRG